MCYFKHPLYLQRSGTFSFVVNISIVIITNVPKKIVPIKIVFRPVLWFFPINFYRALQKKLYNIDYFIWS